MTYLYECKACRFSADVSEPGVDRMREHLKTHAKDARQVRDKAYVMIRQARAAGWPVR